MSLTKPQPNTHYDLLLLPLTSCLHRPRHWLPFNNSTLLLHPFRRTVLPASTSLSHFCAIQLLQPPFDHTRIRITTLGAKEAYLFCEPRRPPVPVSPWMPGQRNAPPEERIQQHALRSHPAMCAMLVQNSEAYKVRLLFNLSSHQAG